MLGATPEGRALYETTAGWRVLAPLTGALQGLGPADT